MAKEKILEIDDSPTVQRLTEMILASDGYEVILASDGEEGIAKARSERPAVILVDFIMPKMNGFQVCKILKEDPDLKDIPIILVTSKGDRVGSKFVDTLGISDFFSKPFQPDDLLAKIREVITKRKEAEIPPPPLKLMIESGPEMLSPAPDKTTTDIEVMVRTIVEQVLDHFMKTTLPGIIRKELKAQLGGGTTGIQGNLSSVRIVEVMQMLGLQRQSGRLVISHGGNDAEVYFKEGTVIFASAYCNQNNTAVEGLLRKSCKINEDNLRQIMRIAEKTSHPIDQILVREQLIDQETFTECLKSHTESAVYQIMIWKAGDFYFDRTASPVFAATVQIRVDDLLLEGARRVDEWDLIRKKIPDFNMVFEPVVENSTDLTSRRMSDIDRKVFSLVNGKRTIQDIIEPLFLGEFDVAKSIFILLSVNLIQQKR
jgi:DNA-binding response OmpR family regulator